MFRHDRRFCFLLATLILLGIAVGTAAAGNEQERITAWQRWKDIGPAIALDPLDGPADILEKVEIIEDRVDELVKEKARLEKEIELNRQQLFILRNQRQTLQELSQIQPQGNSQTSQRLHDLTERINREENLLRIKNESIAGLRRELTHLQTLAAEYREKAKRLQREEGGTQ